MSFVTKFRQSEPILTNTDLFLPVKSYFEDNFAAVVTKVDFIKEKKQEGREQKRRRFCFVTLDDTDLVDELCIRHFHEVANPSDNPSDLSLLTHPPP